MRKSLIFKYFATFSSIILISFTFFAVVLLTQFNSFLSKQKATLLSDNAEIISSLSTQLIGASDYSRNIETTMSAVAHSIGSAIFITDTEGNIYIYSSNAINDQNIDLNGRIPEHALNRLKNGPYTETGFLGGFFHNIYYTAARGIYDQSGTHVGYVFVCTQATDLKIMISEMLRMMTIAFLVVLSVVFIAVYVVTMRMVRPLKQMSYAAGCMARGDFSKRIETKRQDEIGRLAAAFNNMTVALESLERMRRSFVANVSHELKTPMTTIGGFIDGILDGTIPPDKQKEYLAIVSQEITRLSRMVVSMLSLSKLESGEMVVNYTQFDLAEVARQVALTFLQRISEKDIEVVGLDQLPAVSVQADADLMHQVVYNLFDNAVKFTPEGGVITVKAEVSTFNISMSMRNTGRGIRQRELPLVFERFYKTDKSRSVDKTGTGLGLYITKTIIGIFRGTISVNSIEDEYTEFKFTLPANNNIEE